MTLILRRSAMGGPEPTLEDRVRLVSRTANRNATAHHLPHQQHDEHVKQMRRAIAFAQERFDILMSAWHHIRDCKSLPRNHKCPRRPSWEEITAARKHLALVSNHEHLEDDRQNPSSQHRPHVPAVHQWPGDGRAPL
jgi:hypothetical protein